MVYHRRTTPCAVVGQNVEIFNDSMNDFIPARVIQCEEGSSVVDINYGGRSKIQRIDLATVPHKVEFTPELNSNLPDVNDLVGSDIEVLQKNLTYAPAFVKKANSEIRCNLVCYENGYKDWIDLSQYSFKLMKLSKGNDYATTSRSTGSQQNYIDSSRSSTSSNTARSMLLPSWYRNPSAIIEVYGAQSHDLQEEAVVAKINKNRVKLQRRHDQTYFEFNATDTPHKVVLPSGWNDNRNSPSELIGHAIEVLDLEVANCTRLIGTVLSHSDEQPSFVCVESQDESYSEWVDVTSAGIKICHLMSYNDADIEHRTNLPTSRVNNTEEVTITATEVTTPYENEFYTNDTAQEPELVAEEQEPSATTTTIPDHHPTSSAFEQQVPMETEETTAAALTALPDHHPTSSAFEQQVPMETEETAAAAAIVEEVNDSSDLPCYYTSENAVIQVYDENQQTKVDTTLYSVKDNVVLQCETEAGGIINVDRSTSEHIVIYKDGWCCDDIEGDLNDLLGCNIEILTPSKTAITSKIVETSPPAFIKTLSSEEWIDLQQVGFKLHLNSKTGSSSSTGDFPTLAIGQRIEMQEAGTKKFIKAKVSSEAYDSTKYYVVASDGPYKDQQLEFDISTTKCKISLGSKINLQSTIGHKADVYHKETQSVKSGVIEQVSDTGSSAVLVRYKDNTNAWIDFYQTKVKLRLDPNKRNKFKAAAKAATSWASYYQNTQNAAINPVNDNSSWAPAKELFRNYSHQTMSASNHPTESLSKSQSFAIKPLAAAVQKRVPEVLNDIVWYEHKCPETQRRYWVHRASGKSQWNAPKWTEEVDPKTGHTFYHNHEDGSTQWNAPSDYQKIERQHKEHPPVGAAVEAVRQHRISSTV